MPRLIRMRTMSAITLALAAVGLSLYPSAGRAHVNRYKLTCSPERTIARAVKWLKPGDTLLVSGTCNENLDLGEEVQNITLDGQGTATIVGDPTLHAIAVRGRGITIRRFTITGGFQGIAVLDGGSAVIDGNTIEHAAFNGITVFRNSTANIVNNTIQHNASSGIQLQHSSSAQIGFSGPPSNRVSGPNLIQNNGAPGIQVLRGSSAQIFTNTIQNNVSHGVLVDRSAQAEIAACAITGNSGDGVRVMRNGGVDFGTDATNATPRFDDDVNAGTNGGFGVSCTIDGFVDGRLGTLTGTSGGMSVLEGCTDSVVP